MQVYAYQAVDRDGQIISGEMSADDKSDVYGALANQSLTLVQLKEANLVRHRLGGRAFTSEELIEFSRSMASLLAVGIPLLQILEDLESQAARERSRMLIRDIRLRLAGGSTTSEALAEHPKIFSRVYVQLIQAGEASGNLAGAFDKMAEYLDWSRTLRDEVRHAVSYPAIVFGALSVLIAILTLFVFPRLQEVFLSLEIALPLPTRIVLGVGGFVSSAWPYLLGGSFIAGAILAKLWHSRRGRFLCDRLILRIPVIGPLVMTVALARLATTFAALLTAGVQLGESLELTHNSVSNRVIEEGVRQSAEWVEVGDSLGEAFDRAGVFPRFFVRMIHVGEASGDVAGMLMSSANFYEREVPRRMRKLFAAIGPATVAILTVMATVVALSVFLPLMQIGTGLH